MAQTLDTLVFGNGTSESAHGLTTAFGPVTPAAIVTAGGGTQPSNPSATGPSQTAAGGLGLVGRQLLPRTPNADVYGGQMTFTMTVDPVKQNYFTAKMWGSDPAVLEQLVLDCNGYEVGSRHAGGDFGELFWNFSEGWNAGRWVYRTAPLPLNLTVGQTSVTITLRSLGWMNTYNIAAYFTQYQELMNAASPVVYSAYTHTDPYFDSSAEAQGRSPTVLTPLTSTTAAATVASVEKNVNSEVAGMLKGSPTALVPDQIQYMAETYVTTWSTYKGSTALVSQAVAGIDALVTAYAAAPTTYFGGFSNPGWGGYFGPLGDAIRLLWPEINTGNTMSTTVAYGGSLGTVSRTVAWSTALRASVDYGRFNRRTITNQSIFEAMDIYFANRGLELVQPSNALNESEALRYLHEASGSSPWLGNDQAGGGPVPVYGTAPNGPNWFMMTSKATSKEDGMVGSDYGEMGPPLYRAGLISGDAVLQARALAVLRARSNFRYTGLDPNNYLAMMGSDPIGIRGDGLPGQIVYLGGSSSDDFLAAAQGASTIGSNLLGYFQQGINQGQSFPLVTTDPNYMYLTQPPMFPDAWTAASAQPQTGALLPQTLGAGLPNYAWADEENMVVAAKYGSGANEESFYTNMNWHGPAGINGMAKIFDLGSNQARIVEMALQDERFTSSGITLLEPNVVDGFFTPPDNPQPAYGGVPYLEAIRPDLTTLPPTNTDGGRGTGYTLRYGHWLVGMNAYTLPQGQTTPTQSELYAMHMPSDWTSGTDLISGQNFSGQVTLQPKTTVVFYIGDTVDPAPPPARVLFLTAGASGGGVVLNWNAAGSAASYVLKRSTVSGGPYTTIALGLTQLGYFDNTVTNGTTYYYVVESIGTTGLNGGDSPEATATPVAAETAGLPPPWVNADIGTVGAAGSATYSAGTFTVKGAGGDIFNTADAFQYVYAPMNENSSITVKLVSQTNTNNNAKAGVMMRNSLAPGAPNVSLVVTPNGGVQMNRRLTVNGSTYQVLTTTGITAPYWLRLTYTGPNTFTGYTSPDGVTWTQYATTSFTWPLGSSVVGMVDNSLATPTLATDVFSNVTLTAVASGSVPAIPTGLTATVGTGQVSVALNWTASSGATGYNVQRSTVSGGPYTMIATNIATNSFTDPITLTASEYYAVSAVNAIGQSPLSAQVAAVYLVPSFSLSTGAATERMNSGTTISIPFVVSSINGFSAPLTLSCSVPNVAVVCTFAASPLALSGAYTSSSVVVAYPANTATYKVPDRMGQRGGRILAACSLFAIVLSLGATRRRRRIGLLRLGMLIILSLGVLGYSGCSSPTSAPTPTSVLHTLTITAVSGSEAQTATLMLEVTNP
jgi:hypothetical protein